MSAKPLSVARFVVGASLLAEFVSMVFLIVTQLGLAKLLEVLAKPGPELLFVVLTVAAGALLYPAVSGRRWALFGALGLHLLIILLLMPPFLFWFPRPHGFRDWVTFTGLVSAAVTGIGFGVVAVREAFGNLAPASYRIDGGLSRQGATAWVLAGLVAGMTLLAGATAASPVSAGSNALAEAPERMVKLEMGPMTFSPTAFELEAGKATAIFITNTDGTPHDFTIDELGIKVTAEPGQTVMALVKPTAPGTLTFICSLSGHHEAGMAGTITVK